MAVVATGLRMALGDAEAEKRALQTEVAGLKLKCNLLSSKLETKSHYMKADTEETEYGLLHRIPSLEKEVEMLRSQVSRSGFEASDLLSTAASEGVKPSFPPSESLLHSYPSIEDVMRRIEAQELACTRAQVERDASQARSERDRADLEALTHEADSRCARLGTVAREAEQARALISEQLSCLLVHCRALHDTTGEIFHMLQAERQKCEKLRQVMRVQCGKKDEEQSVYETAMCELDAQQVEALNAKLRELQSEYSGFASLYRHSTEASEEAMGLRNASEQELASMQEQLETLREDPQQDEIFFAAMQELLQRVEAFVENGGTSRSLCNNNRYSGGTRNSGSRRCQRETADAETQCAMSSTTPAETRGGFGLSFSQLVCGSREPYRQEPTAHRN